MGEVVNIDTIKLDDQKTFELLRSMKTKGVFQLEAVIPREALNKCKADRLEDIIAITSLNRPGPMDNIPSYIKRKLGTEHIQYISESLKDALGETYGIIIYQEQVLKVAQIIAGYTPGAADILRRAMGKKIKEEMDAQRNIFIQGALKVGIVNEKGANEIFNILEKFAGYGFNKAHATCYSVISYQTAYLKANYPTDFFVSVFNLEIHNTDKLNEFINDAKRFDVSVLPPDINKSNAYFDAVSDNVISYGIIGLKSLGKKLRIRLLKLEMINHLLIYLIFAKELVILLLVKNSSRILYPPAALTLYILIENNFLNLWIFLLNTLLLVRILKMVQIFLILIL